MSSVPTAEVYLAPGFEPSSLKVAQLRGILTEHSIPIPSTSKKADLVRLFLDRVKSKARAYHDRAASVVPSTDGIREVDEDGVEMSPEPPRIVKSIPSRSRQSVKPREPAPAEVELGLEMEVEAEQDQAGDVFTAPTDEYLVVTGTGDDIARRRTRRITRSQTPLTAPLHNNDNMPNGLSVDGLPRPSSTLRTKPSVPSFPEHVEEAGGESVSEPKKKGSRKTKKGALDLGLGPEVQIGIEGQLEEEEHGWEKTPSRNKNALSSASNMSTPTPATLTKNAGTAGASRTYESPNKFTPLATSKQPTGVSGREESGFSDYNPFQSGEGDEGEMIGTKKTPRKTKRKTMGERKSSGLEPAAESPVGQPSPAKAEAHTSPSKSLTPSPVKRIINLASSAMSPVQRSPSPRKIEPDWKSVKTTPEGWKRQSVTQGSPSKVARFAEDQIVDHEAPDAFDDEMDIDVDVKVERERQHETPSRKAREVSSPVKTLTPISKDRSTQEESRLVQRGPNALASTPETKIKFSMLMALLAFLLWAYQFQQQSIPLGYCDPATSSNSIIRAKEARLVKANACVAEREVKRRDQAVPDDQLQVCPYETELPLIGFVPRADKCTPCPSHAMCKDGRVNGCQGDYILEPHPLLDWLNPALSGLPGVGPVAFPPTCELDVKTKAQIGEIAKKVEERLASRKGEVVCAGGASRRKHKGDKKSEAELFGIGEEELFQHFVRMVKVTPEAFRQNLRAALKDLVVHKIVHHEVVDGRDVYSAVRADMSASCRLRIAATEQIVDHKNELGLGTFGLALLAYLKSYYQNKRKEDAKVKKLVKTALSRLQDQQYTHYIDPVQAPEPFLRPNQLRDFVLDHIHNASTRQRLWAKVQPIIETNANVRVGEQEVMGDTWKIWEWVGVSKMDSQLLSSVEGSMYPDAS